MVRLEANFMEGYWGEGPLNLFKGVPYITNPMAIDH